MHNWEKDMVGCRTEKILVESPEQVCKGRRGGFRLTKVDKLG